MDRQAHHLSEQNLPLECRRGAALRAPDYCRELIRPTRAPAASVLLALLLTLLTSRAALAQHDAVSWRFGTDAVGSLVQEARSAGYPALPVAALRQLGADVAVVSDGVRLRLGEAEVHLRIGSPFFIANGQVRQLVHAVYEHGGTTYVPLQLVVDHLPSLLGDALAVDVGARTVTHLPARAPAEAQLAAAPAPVTPAPTAPAPTAPAPTAPVVRPAPARPAPARPAPGAARRLVVIDAGHGGVDPGARGPSGVREKDVALAVAHRLATLLRQDPTLEVRMTRERDTLIALTDRTRMANRWRSEGQEALFMSIHANAHERRTARGFETFFLSEARTEDARRVAQMENAAQRFENPGQRLDPLSFILHDLRQNQYLRESSDWAVMIQDRLAAVHSGPNRGVKQAGFVVLNGAFMPAVLVELGFITNPTEERMLADSAHQARLAAQLAYAVRDFFDRAPFSTAAP
jgi:N-acetylmuramoyl-L-alanine amidase